MKRRVVKYSGFQLKVMLMIISACSVFAGCESFVEVKPSSSTINSMNVFGANGTAIAAVTEIYGRLANIEGVASVNLSFSINPALVADELSLFGQSTNVNHLAYYRNELRTNVSENRGGALWTFLYRCLLATNASIEGLTESTTLSGYVKRHLLGECYFMRAFCYFYLVNYYGDVPLALTSDPNINNDIPRAPQAKVYEQIVADLLEAKELLEPAYVNKDRVADANAERILIHRGTATALLARTYLFMGSNDAAAESNASEVISQTNLYQLLPLNEVFLKNSKETIWAFQGVTNWRNTQEGFAFILPAGGPNAVNNPFYLNSSFLNAFEEGDERATPDNWVNRMTTLTGLTYYYPFKYKSREATVTEYNIVLRLAEQYLIRAEARARQNKLTGANSAASDLNIIRERAGLPPTTATTQEALLDAILQERRVELFTEWGHRWLDIKRTGKVDDVMEVAAGEKGTTWRSFQQWYPIPFTDIQRGLNLVQNEGY